MSNIDSKLYTQLLGKQIEIWQAITNLAREKRQILIDGNVEQLNEIVAHEERLISEVSRMEKQRYEAFVQLADSLDLPSTATLQEIIARCPEGFGQTLQQLGADLSGLLNGIQELNKQNVNLIEQSLDLVRFTVESLACSQQEPTYNPQDTRQKSSVSFLIDTKV